MVQSADVFIAEAAATTNTPITLLYVRPRGLDLAQLDARVKSVAARYLSQVSIVEVESAREHPGVLEENGQPAVLVLRGDELVGKAMGSLLPERELDRVVRRALAGS